MIHVMDTLMLDYAFGGVEPFCGALHILLVCVCVCVLHVKEDAAATSSSSSSEVAAKAAKDHPGPYVLFVLFVIYVLFVLAVEIVCVIVGCVFACVCIGCRICTLAAGPSSWIQRANHRFEDMQCEEKGLATLQEDKVRMNKFEEKVKDTSDHGL